MKHLLLTTIAAVLLVGCGESAKDIPFWKAAGDGNIEAVKQHLANGTDVNAENGPVGRTPLHEAALRGRKEVVELVIDKDADVNAKNWEGGTPLHYAALTGRKEIAELLIAAGADVNAKDVSGKTPLDIAAHPENPNDTAETIDLIRKHGGKTGDWLNAEGK